MVIILPRRLGHMEPPAHVTEWTISFKQVWYLSVWLDKSRFSFQKSIKIGKNQQLNRLDLDSLVIIFYLMIELFSRGSRLNQTARSTGSPLVQFLKHWS